MPAWKNAGRGWGLDIDNAKTLLESYSQHHKLKGPRFEEKEIHHESDDSYNFKAALGQVEEGTVETSFQVGKSYDELEIGDHASFTKTITETDVYLFAGISGDFNPLHLNEEYAKQTRFKKRIAHGVLPQSLIAPVLGMQLPGMGTIAVEITTRFKAPTYFGDTVTATAKVAEKLEDKKWVKMTLSWTNQKGEIIAEGEAIVIPPTK